MAETFTAVDLSRLSAPAVLEALSFETVFADLLASFQTLFPEYDAVVESDPIIKLLQLFAYRELILRGRVNDAARAVMPAYAIGTDLDHLAALFGVTRLLITPASEDASAVYESDDDLRRRLVLAPEGYSVAGPEGAYIYHALSANADVLDASATSPTPDDIRAIVLQVLEDGEADPELVDAMTTALDAADWPGEVFVSILSRTGDGTAGAPLVDAVTAYLSADTRRPLTDALTVQAAEIVEFTIEAGIKTYAGPDSSVVIAAANARLTKLLDESHRLGRDVNRAAIIAALFAEGVQNVTLTSPATDIVIDRNQAPWCTGRTITHTGIGE